MDQPTNPVQVSATVAILVELQQLQPLLAGTYESLKRQRDMLQQRGMGIPPMTMQSMDGMLDALKQFEKLLSTEQIEVAQLRSLAENAAAISRSLVLDVVLRDAMDGVITLSGAERGCIILVDTATQELDFRVLRDNETIHNREQVTHAVPPEKAAQFSRSVIRKVMETGEPLLTSNANDDERLSGMQSVIALDLRSVMCAPLRIKDQTLGVVYVDNRLKFGVFGEREKNLVAAFANQVAAAISNARLFADLQRTLSDITRVKDLTDNVFNSIDSGVVTTDDVGIILRANRAAADLLDSPAPENLSGQHLGAVVGPMKEALQDALKSVRDTGEVQIVEAEVSVGRRGRAVLQAKVSPLKSSDGTTQGAAMVMDDLTEHRERNETLRILKYYLPTAMLDNITQIAGLGFGGERREITCMFVDTLPLAHLPKGMRPQEVMQAINIYLSLASDCIHDAGGVIDKYMGTEVMALFNSQLNPLKNHAAAAVDAALRIREHFKVLYESMGQTNHVYHIGINTGVATLGNVGSHNRRDFTAIGDSINLSKRLEENAADGQIIISDETRKHLLANPVASRMKLRFEQREALQVKGRQQQTDIYEVFAE
jgi:PAS domain S-box-containing protein